MPNYNSIHTGSAIDTAVTGVASKAPLVHTHLIADVTDAATVASTGSYDDLTDRPTLGTSSALNVPSTGDALSTEVVKGNDSRLTNARTPLAHTHAILDVSGLQTALDGKASSVHSHAISDVTGLQTVLGGKSDTTHAHTGVYEPANANIQSHISATNNPHGTTATQVGAYTTAQVDTLLNGKADTVHNHNDLYYTESEVDTLLGGKANTTHTHAIGDVTGLQTALDGKQPTGSYLTTSAIGTTVQAYDADLTAWSGVATTAKQDTLVSGTNIKTINSQSILGSGDLVISGGGSSPTLTINNKTAAYTVVAGDLGKIINCTSGSFTVSLTAAATLGAGFNVTVRNTSTTAADVVTIDGNGSETVGGLSTLNLQIGEGVQLICDGVNWQLGNEQSLKLYSESASPTVVRPVASGASSVAIGAASTASGASSLALGNSVLASSGNSVAIGRNSASQGSQAVTGSAAMALGGSYASGTDSFAAAIANNTSSYGATGANSVAIGNRNRSSGATSSTIGGGYSIASAALAYCLGDYCEATQILSYAVGSQAKSDVYGKYAYASAAFISAGDAQKGTCVLRKSTTSTTPTVLTSNNSTAGTTNQVILPNNSTYAFTGTIVAQQSKAQGSATAAWKVEGLITRGANAAATTLVASTVTAISNTPAWTLALSADTTNGGLAVTFTGAAATNIRTVATIETVEVTYA
jgi:hypothetical protein